MRLVVPPLTSPRRRLDLDVIRKFQVGDEDHDNVEFEGVRVPIAPAQPVARVGGPTRGRLWVQTPPFTAAGPAFGTALSTTDGRSA